MNKIVLASASILLASVVSAAAMPKAPATQGLNQTALVQVKSKKMGHMSGKHMSGHRMKGHDTDRMKGMGGMQGGEMKGDSMKGGSMKGMKGM